MVSKQNKFVVSFISDTVNFALEPNFFSDRNSSLFSPTLPLLRQMVCSGSSDPTVKDPHVPALASFSLLMKESSKRQRSLQRPGRMHTVYWVLSADHECVITCTVPSAINASPVVVLHFQHHDDMDDYVRPHLTDSITGRRRTSTL
jgi:hypothetical protein